MSAVANLMASNFGKLGLVLYKVNKWLDSNYGSITKR
jgi:hypothetical protein